ncbi:hypothetical protein AVEN_209625-1 [Araneus ventricosus]|uniref:MATH domain-containing protein n=1 Tax=Araneus ventricosus TaxID=182803 RepID=A0A4Y2D777_ARAVE|nr:hypothetical protein AVEN_209625-1 [Araneus ventricosus]
MAFEESGKFFFAFTWKLENASYCLEKEGEEIKSPAFVVDSIDETKWKLGLYPRGEEHHGKYIGFYLFREIDGSGNLLRTCFHRKRWFCPEILQGI